MGIRGLVGAVAFLFMSFSGVSQAIGLFIPAAERVDMAYDEKRDIVYITSGGDVLRYAVGQRAFLPKVVIGGALRGVDLSPDGNTLAVADSTSGTSTLWVHLVDLDSLASRKQEAPKQSYGSGTYYEGGTWAVSYAADGALFFTSQYPGSGWTPLRRYTIASGVSVAIPSVRQNTMVSASGDRKIIGFAESNISDGRWGLLKVESGEIVRRSGYDNGTSWFNFEIAANPDGSQIAIPTYGGTFIYNAAYQKIATLGIYANEQPVAAAYDPVDNLAYFPWARTSEVRVYDMDALVEVGRYDFETQFSSTGNAAYQSGRTRLSGDGSLLMVTVDGGVRILRMYAPLSANPLSVVVSPSSRQKIRLLGSVGNGALPTYELVRGPEHGRVVIAGGFATYVHSSPRYSGPDSFVYRARYGRAKADAVVALSIRGGQVSAGTSLAEPR